MTGRGLGYCAGRTAPGFQNAGPGRGGGRGWRNCFLATGLPGWLRWGAQSMVAAAPETDPQAELRQLRKQVADAEARLAALEKRTAHD